MKKKTVTKKTTKLTAEEQAKMKAQAQALHDQTNTLTAAVDATRSAAYQALAARLVLAWQTMGLGESGVLVLPKSWYEGPEQYRRLGVANLKLQWPGHIMLQCSLTETASALLNSRDQSVLATSFLNNYSHELAQLGTLAY